MKLISLIAFILLNTSCPFLKKRDNITKTIRAADTINFERQVQPILKANCSPCHFPGGKMYKKMPFDSGQTLLSHEAGILRRIKNEKDKDIIRRYINENIKTAEH